MIELQKILETKANITFSQKTIELFQAKGYHRLKSVILYCHRYNIRISNNSIVSIYKNEKHLRHMLGPRIETFELTILNHVLHEITRISNDKNPFSPGVSHKLFIKSKVTNLVNYLNSNLPKRLKDKKFKVTKSSYMIFD